MLYEVITPIGRISSCFNFMKNLLRYIIARTLLTIPMLFILLSVVFLVVRIMPGNPVGAMLGGHAPEKVIEAKKEELGLNRPLIVQYGSYLLQIGRLDLGESRNNFV